MKKNRTPRTRFGGDFKKIEPREKKILESELKGGGLKDNFIPRLNLWQKSYLSLTNLVGAGNNIRRAPNTLKTS